LKGHDDAITIMEGIGDMGPQSSNLVCTGSIDKSIRVWDGRAKKAQIFLFKGHADSILELRWGEGGRSVISASKDKTIRIWDTRAGRQRSVLEKHFGAVNGLRAIPEGLGRGILRGETLSFISSGRDSHLNLWTSSGECVGTQSAHRGSVHYMSDINYNLNCKPSTFNTPVIISCGGENSVKLWDIRKFKNLSEFVVPSSYGTVIKLGWWGQSLITATNTGNIKMWSYIPCNDDNNQINSKNDKEKIELLSESLNNIMQSADQYLVDGSWIEHLTIDIEHAKVLLRALKLGAYAE
jgi:WD40 repeat protein